MQNKPTGYQPARGVALPPSRALVRRCCHRSDLSPGQSGLDDDVRSTREQAQRGLVSQS